VSGAGSDPKPFEFTPADAKQYAPAAARNREPIAQALRGVLPPSGLVLEIASGTGEHAVHFARCFPDLDWQPSDMAEAALSSIAAWREESGATNLKAPLRIDLLSGTWPIDRADAIFCANMAHIAPWEATVGLFEGAGRILDGAGPLVIYGPFLEKGLATAPSNMAFDANLKARDASWGLRRLEDLDRLAVRAGMVRTARAAMPANNLLLVYRRK